ncbi:hypothetical protein ACO22_03959 [Paracoccidioides brasiliensis]|uniref:Uncharacterized protein n=1 Tax=Paracoccidioides brasiliensis TaxID=121759 RepID=A0A1D2JEG4_PARBR|nr:hypothetical protein ACO22_03959 [Paracoccidioides brasiliensis]
MFGQCEVNRSVDVLRPLMKGSKFKRADEWPAPERQDCFHSALDAILTDLTLAYYEIRCSTALGVNPKDATQGAHEVAPRAITNPINVRMPLVV